MHWKNIIFSILAFALTAFAAEAHVNGKASVHDVIATLKERAIAQLSHEEVVSLSVDQALEMLTEDERDALATNMFVFNVNVPVTLYVMSDADLEGDPFWLEEREFVKTEMVVDMDGDPFAVWKKDFPAGQIGLGIPAFREPENTYFLALKPQNDGDEVEVAGMYPSQPRVSELQVGAEPYVDSGDEIEEAPGELVGLKMIQTVSKWAALCQVVDLYRLTRFPASDKPDQITLTWSDDPKTTQTIQWRTSPAIDKAVVQYVKKSDFNRFHPKAPRLAVGATVPLETPDIINDPVNHRHTVTLTGLEPETTYVYSVGDGSDEGWSETAEFTTAPDEIRPFTFIYMGDAQNGLDRWGSLLNTAHRQRPDALFYVMAGDLVNRGNERWDWDDFFYNARNVYNQRQLVPAIGNHENQNGHPWMYLDMFTLPENGPEQIEPERAYTFNYSNAQFIILDTNLDPADQAAWLEETLAESDATWKFVVYHHPAYSSAPRRDNPDVREHWTPLFDEYGVDMAMQGHDHAYLRTHPLKNGVKVDQDEGVIYIVSVSGVKMYDQADRSYTAFGMTNVSTFQVLDIQVIGDRLLYRAYDTDGNLRDQFELKK